MAVAKAKFEQLPMCVSRVSPNVHFNSYEFCYIATPFTYIHMSFFYDMRPVIEPNLTE